MDAPPPRDEDLGLRSKLQGGTLRASVSVDELVALLATTGVLERDEIIMILADIFAFDGTAPPDLVTVELSVDGSRIAAVE